MHRLNFATAAGALPAIGFLAISAGYARELSEGRRVAEHWRTHTLQVIIDSQRLKLRKLCAGRNLCGRQRQMRTLASGEHVLGKISRYCGFSAYFCRFLALFRGIFRSPGAVILRAGQVLAHDVDIGQGELAENLLPVLVEPPLA
jgi:hypothetical protein